MDQFPNISIVILTYNSEKTLSSCLQAVGELDYPKKLIEVILLDNGSTDDTLPIIQKFGYNHEDLPDLNLSELRNHGAEVSSGDIIAYIDSDCVVAADWLLQAVKWFDDPTVGIVGNEYLLPADATMFERNWYNRSNYAVKYDDLIPAGNMAVRKDLFHQLGGFDNKLETGEDDYLLTSFRNAGFKTVSDSKICSEHLGNAKTLLEYFRKERWYGKGMLGTLHLSKFDKPLIATALFSILCFTCIFFLISYLIYGIMWMLTITLSSLACSALLPALAAIDRICIKQRKGFFPFVILIFTVFFFARSTSLIQTGAENMRRNSIKTGAII